MPSRGRRRAIDESGWESGDRTTAASLRSFRGVEASRRDDEEQERMANFRRRSPRVSERGPTLQASPHFYPNSLQTRSELYCPTRREFAAAATKIQSSCALFRQRHRARRSNSRAFLPFLGPIPRKLTYNFLFQIESTSAIKLRGSMCRVGIGFVPYSYPRKRAPLYARFEHGSGLDSSGVEARGDDRFIKS